MTVARAGGRGHRGEGAPGSGGCATGRGRVQQPAGGRRRDGGQDPERAAGRGAGGQAAPPARPPWGAARQVRALYIITSLHLDSIALLG
jgi:hypothetical protein